ncbi:MAG: phosphotyrosine protein phosphatase [Pseudomonadota bacterium]
MTRILFLCADGRARGPTAAQIFAERPGIATDFAAVESGAADAVSAEQLDWADVIMVMELRHKTRLAERFGAKLRGRPVINLNIPDRFTFMDDRLVVLMRDMADEHLKGRQ